MTVSPAAALLANEGATTRLAAVALDAAGVALPGRIEWSSSAPERVAVDAEGRVTAMVSAGSAQIVASVDGVASQPVLVLVAETAPGAVRVPDAAVVAPPVPVDPDAPWGVGLRYRVVLAGPDLPAPGTVLVGSESAPIAGRVVTAETTDAGVAVELQVIPLPQLFSRLAIDERFDLRRAPVDIPPAVAAAYDVSEAPDGTLTFSLRAPDGPLAQASALPCPTCIPQGVAVAGWDCKEEGTFPLASFLSPSLTIEPDLDFDVKSDPDTGKLTKFEVKGSIEAKLENEIEIGASAEGKVECENVLAVKRIPIPAGPLSLVLGGHVGLGVGVEIGGKVTVPGLVSKGELVAKAEGRGGVTRPANGSLFDMDLHADFTPSVDADWKTVVPPSFLGDVSVFDLARAEIEAAAFGFLDLRVGPPILTRLQIVLLKVKTGLAAEASYGAISGQLLDPTYESKAELALERSYGLGDGVIAFGEIIGVTILDKLEAKLSLPLAETPQLDEATASPSTFLVGDPVHFVVELEDDSVDWPLVGYNVEAIEVYDQPSFAAGTFRRVARVTPSSAGQTRFELDWIADRSGVVTDHFFVAVVPGFPVPDAMPFEIGQVKEASPTTTTTTTSTTTSSTTTSSPPLVASVTCDGNAAATSGAAGSVGVQCNDAGDGLPVEASCSSDTSSRDGTNIHADGAAAATGAGGLGGVTLQCSASAHAMFVPFQGSSVGSASATGSCVLDIRQGALVVSGVLEASADAGGDASAGVLSLTSERGFPITITEGPVRLGVGRYAFQCGARASASLGGAFDATASASLSAAFSAP